MPGVGRVATGSQRGLPRGMGEGRLVRGGGGVFLPRTRGAPRLWALTPGARVKPLCGPPDESHELNIGAKNRAWCVVAPANAFATVITINGRPAGSPVLGTRSLIPLGGSERGSCRRRPRADGEAVLCSGPMRRQVGLGGTCRWARHRSPCPASGRPLRPSGSHRRA